MDHQAKIRLLRDNVETVIRGTYDTTLEALMEALDTRDTETQGHSRRVSEYTVAVARRMGVAEPDLTQMRWGCLLYTSPSPRDISGSRMPSSA